MKGIFSPNVIIRYPAGLKPEQLKHVFDPSGRKTVGGKAIDFRRVALLLEGANNDVVQNYEKEFGIKFDKYKLGERTGWVQAQFHEDARFLEAINLLGHSEQQAQLIKLPWWNEVACSEVGHKRRGGVVTITIAPRHSYETQLMREDVQIGGVQNVSVAGIAITTDGWIAIGLRKGASYSNTYHINAGALGLTEGIMDGSQSIYQFFLEKEQRAEFGTRMESIEKVELGSRVVDRVLDKGTMYVFNVGVNVTFDELQKQYEGNMDEDKGEHTRLVAIRDSPEAIWKFVEQHYRGDVQSRDDRKDSERFLLHPGALALVAHIGGKASDLANLYREGKW